MAYVTGWTCAGAWVLIPLMLAAADAQDAPNPWSERVAGALRAAERSGTAQAYLDALDAAWRGDDWRGGLQLAQQVQRRFPDQPRLAAASARALRRAGLLEEAERIALDLKPDADDAVALWTLLALHGARGESEATRIAIAGLERLRKPGATELFALYSVRQEQQRLAGLPKLLERAVAAADPAHGYPEAFISESLVGLADFYRQIGPQPVNEVVRHGAVPMPMALLLGLPYCEVLIDGKGPYRLIIDTGGSITLSLDTRVAEELALKSMAEATVRGVSGTQKSGQALVGKLELGRIECRRVLTRTFEMPEALRLQADGVLGTGIFSQTRMTLDFRNSELVVAPSSQGPAVGSECAMRLIGDAKILAAATINERRIFGLIDSGANVVALAPSLAEDLFPDEKPRPVAAGVRAGGVGEGGDPGLRLTRGVTLEIWGRTRENYSGVALAALDYPLSSYLGVQTFALIGMPILRELATFTVDFPRRRLWVQWARGDDDGAARP